jgi:two-component system, NtrC family, response regulator AtoC
MSGSRIPEPTSRGLTTAIDGLVPTSTLALELLVSGGSTLSVIALAPRRTYVIGRDASCDIVVNDVSVSRRHARITVNRNVTIVELGSRNGTVMEGARLERDIPVVMPVGTVVMAGRATLVLQHARSSAAAAGATGDSLGRTARPARGQSETIVIDPAMQSLYAMLDIVAPAPISALILGETGVGKEVFAAELHRRSSRANDSFLALNCAAMQESLLEAELFGYERGAFTGAAQAKAGLLESADGGTVFLDEVGDMALATQAKLLRVVECGEVLRIGSLTPRRVNVRFVAATNRNLEEAIADGKFRSDLFFRLNGITFTLPPLRARVADIAHLSRHFVADIAARMNRTPPTLSAGAIQTLERAAWPGNVRELRNVIERAVVLCQGDEIDVPNLVGIPAPTQPISNSDVGSGIFDMERGTMPTFRHGQRGADDGRANESSARTLDDAVRNVERERIFNALTTCAGNQSRAAKMLKISRTTLVARLDQFGISRPRKP